jgi:hypothetical protein
MVFYPDCGGPRGQYKARPGSSASLEPSPSSSARATHLSFRRKIFSAIHAQRRDPGAADVSKTRSRPASQERPARQIAVRKAGLAPVAGRKSRAAYPRMPAVGRQPRGRFRHLIRLLWHWGQKSAILFAAHDEEFVSACGAAVIEMRSLLDTGQSAPSVR